MIDKYRVGVYIKDTLQGYLKWKEDVYELLRRENNSSF